MRIGLLETGKVNPDLVAANGTYPEMFRRFLTEADPSFTLEPWDVVERGEIPASPHDADGWLITGSKYGVYDDLPWIAPLKRFLAEAYSARVPIVGICFGHQLLAEALGGRAIKSDRGWGAGLQRYKLTAQEPWMGGTCESIAVHAMHQDQVVTLPDGARVFAETPHCPYAGIAYGDTAMSIQPHPEFERGYERDLIDIRSGGLGIPEPVADAAMESLAGEADNALVGRWVTEFFRQAHEARSAV